MELCATDVASIIAFVPVIIFGAFAFFAMALSIDEDSKFNRLTMNLYHAFIRRNIDWKKDPIVEHLIEWCYNDPTSVAFHFGELDNVYFRKEDGTSFARLVLYDNRFSYLRWERSNCDFVDVDKAYNFYLFKALRYARANGGQYLDTPTTYGVW